MDWNNGSRGAASRMKRIALVVGAFLFVQGAFAQTLPNSKLWSPITAGIAKEQVTEQPDLKGGHLQGVQLREGKLYVSGSSDRFAYLTIFAMQEVELKFIGTKKLGEKPMNHAGGFQLADNWLAIGIEDPTSRRESQVQLIDVSTSKSFSAPPAFVLHRKGQQGRSTAGAVALLRRKDHFLLAVGSWNSTVIDFYTSNGLDPYAADFNFKLWTSWDSREALRKTWTDRDYGSYQSIQLTSDSGVVYLSGFCLDGKINRNSKVRIIRDGVVIYSGELASLKRFKEDVKEVATNYECGLNIQNFNNIEVGDIVEAYEQVEVKRKL